MNLFSKKTYKEIRQISINSIIYKVSIFYEKRRNSRVSITKTGINLRIANFLSKKEQDIQINKFLDWATNTIKENKIKFPTKLKSFKNGDILKLYDNTLKIEIIEITKNKVYGKILKDRIVIKISKTLKKEDRDKHVSKTISKLLQNSYLQKISTKLHYFNDLHKFGVINNIRLKNNSTNWGSCSSKNNINISIRLFLAPESVVDYVLIHELSHLKQRNHSYKFWEIVRNACPYYLEAEKWLKQNSSACII